MDDYIKRKQKNVTQPSSLRNDGENGKSQNQSQIIIRQSRQQIKDLFCKLEYCQQRLGTIKKNLTAVQLKSNLIVSKTTPILVETSLQKSPVAPQVSNRQTSDTKHEVQQVIKLESTEDMATVRSPESTRQQSTVASNEKLQQSSKGFGKPRKIRKKF